MIGLRPIRRGLRLFVVAEAGSALVEFAVVLPIFLLLLFALLDFGRMGFQYVMAQRAMQIAARLAVVRPAACLGVRANYSLNAAIAAGSAPNFGTSCATTIGGAFVCANPGTVSCDGDASNATTAEIWADIAPLMPPEAGPASLRFSYAFNADFGFLGGPYVPMVSVTIQNLDFTFLSPLGALVKLAGAVNSNLPTTLPFPAISVSLPAEDLAQGANG